jgi:hypothetical protein
MIDLNKKYETKNGDEVELISDKCRKKNFPILGYIGVSDPEEYYWDSHGGSYSRVSQDLVEVKPKVKYLKPLHIVLAEADDYGFNMSDCLVIRKEDMSYVGLGKHFGRPLHGLPVGCSAHSSWIELKDAP